jgi:hypothetical protein
LTALPFVLLFLLFNFNGYITSHIAVGHSMWNGYFLLPFFFILLFELMEGRREESLLVIEFSFFLFLLCLQGSFHIFVWCLFFLSIFGAFNRRHLRSVFLIIGLALLVSSFRLLPAALTFYKKGYPFLFISGFPGAKAFFYALAVIKDVAYRQFKMSMGWWEFDTYISVIGLAFIAYFGIYLRFSKNPLLKDCKYREMDAPVFLMALLSIGPLYSYVSNLPIPFLNSQRYSSRFFIIPLAALMIISCLRLKELLPGLKKMKYFKASAAACIGALAILLARHSWLWRIENIERHFGAEAVETTLNRVIKAYPVYTNSVTISAAISLSAVLVLTFFYIIKRAKIFPSRN